MYLQCRIYSYPWLQISKELMDVRSHFTSLVIPNYNITIEWEDLDKCPVPVEPKLKSIIGSQSSGVGSTYILLDFKVKLSNNIVELPGFGGMDITGLTRHVFIDPEFTGGRGTNLGLNTLNYKYNVYGGYFHSAHIKLGGLI